MADDNKQELSTALFSAANALRSKMDANEYKNYLLGIIFWVSVNWCWWRRIIILKI